MDERIIVFSFLFLLLVVPSISAQTPSVSVGKSSGGDGVSIPNVNINPQPENIAVTTWINYTSVGEIPHNDLGGLQGGSSGEYFHLNQSIFNYFRI